MEDIDGMILNCVSTEFKGVRQISEELNLPYIRTAVRIKHLRKRRELISVQSNEPHIRGVKPLKYKKQLVD